MNLVLRTILRKTEEQSDSGISKASNTSAEEQASAEPATERKLKKQIFRVPLK
ncbi:heat-shock protein, partial [Trifolium medium]|nr:heat-shock protein [Trifolium medium]